MLTAEEQRPSHRSHHGKQLERVLGSRNILFGGLVPARNHGTRKGAIATVGVPYRQLLLDRRSVNIVEVDRVVFLVRHDSLCGRHVVDVIWSLRGVLAITRLDADTPVFTGSNSCGAESR